MRIEIPIQVADLADALALKIEGPALGAVSTIGNLNDAKTGMLCALFERRFITDARQTSAAAVLVSEELSDALPPSCTRLISSEPRRDWARALRLLYPQPQISPPPIGTHPGAVVEDTAFLHENVSIGPLAYVGPGSTIGPDAQIFAGAYIGRNVTIGAETILMPGARVLDGCHIGAHCWIGPGAIIGSIGFGVDAKGRMPHLGGVHMGEHCSVGANTCIDRGSISDTLIGSNVHIDNLVQVGHNVTIEDGVIICGQAGIAGGVVIGSASVIGGQAGIAGHLQVGENIRIAAQSGVTRSLSQAGDYSGHPAEPNRQRLKRLARLKKLTES